jgi:hypothetical protein
MCQQWTPGDYHMMVTMDDGIERDNTSGEGAFLRCPVSTSVQFSLREEGYTEYMYVRGKITGDNIYRCQSACPVVLNDFYLFKENKTSQSL